MFDHLLRNLEVGDDSVPEGSDSFDVVGRLSHHQLRVDADRSHTPRAVYPFHGHDRWLVEDDPASFNVHNGISSPEIDREASRAPFEQTADNMSYGSADRSLNTSVHPGVRGKSSNVRFRPIAGHQGASTTKTWENRLGHHSSQVQMPSLRVRFPSLPHHPLQDRNLRFRIRRSGAGCHPRWPS